MYEEEFVDPGDCVGDEERFRQVRVLEEPRERLNGGPRLPGLEVGDGERDAGRLVHAQLPGDDRHGPRDRLLNERAALRKQPPDPGEIGRAGAVQPDAEQLHRRGPQDLGL